MAFNKSKALENALKFLNQGKVPQAIGEYQQILRNDPKDQATLMTVGDLYARQGDMSHAIEYFERLAQVYLNDGFNSKAIAIYKKIAKLAPNELAPLERLADLYVQQGVLSEARPLFLQIAEAHLKANRAPKAVDVLHRLLDVEPENPRVQMRLAELYNVMGQKKEAAQTYLDYAQRLFDRGEPEEAEKLVERALEVDPANGAALLLNAKTLIAAARRPTPSRFWKLIRRRTPAVKSPRCCSTSNSSPAKWRKPQIALASNSRGATSTPARFTPCWKRRSRAARRWKQCACSKSFAIR